MRIFLTSTAPADATVVGISAQMQSALERLTPRYGLADTARSADAILFVESGQNKFASFAKILKSREELMEYPSKCFVFDFTDRPVVFMSGLYFSLSRSKFNPIRTRAMTAWDVTPESVYRAVIDLGCEPDPPLLFSFRGFESAEVRARIFRSDFGEVPHSIIRTERWWDYGDDDEQRTSYLREIRQSSFVLAPRGLGTSTLRLYEAMRLGSVPVILSNEWVPPRAVPWDDFSIRVAEDRVSELPAILMKYQPWAQEMGANARISWEKWCQPGPILMRGLAQQLESLTLGRPSSHDEREMYERWSTQRFAWENGWHPFQKVAAAVQRGTLASDVRTYVQRRSRWA